MSNLESVLADATQLSIVDRLQLIEALWETVPEVALRELSAEWRAEIEKRSNDFDSGQANAVPWSQVRETALNRLGEKKD